MNVLPIDIYEIIVSYGQTKIEKRKFYYLLAVTIKSFGIESTKKRFSNQYKKIIGIQPFVPLINEMDRYMAQSPSEIISEYTTRTLTEKGNPSAKLVVNMYEYITLTKDGRDMMINNQEMLKNFVLKFKLDFLARINDIRIRDVQERMEVFEKIIFYKKIHKLEHDAYFTKNYYSMVYIRQTLLLREIPGINTKSTKSEMQQISAKYIII